MFGMVVLLFRPGQLALAQDGGRVIISPPETDQFPTVGLYLQVYDSMGNFIEDLQPGQVQVIENGTSIPVMELSRLEPGIQITIAMNLDAMMGHSTGATTYYQQIQLALVNWAQNQPQSSPDNFSLSTNTGLYVIHQTDPQQWLQNISTFQPDLANSQPSLTSLNSALQIAGDPNPRPYMSRVIVYITPLPDVSAQQALPNLAELAAQLGTRVIVWLVAPEAQANSSEAQVLHQLADRTGGQFYMFSGNNALPDLQATLRPLRFLYHLVYNSTVSNSATNRLAIQVSRPGIQATSQEQTYNLKILPPNPMFVSPPTLVERAPAAEGTGELEPLTVSIKMLVEFPDGLTRPLQIARLYVNDKVVEEKTQPPFDEFELSLANINENEHLLMKVEVLDSLGLIASSIEAPLDVEVKIPQASGLSRLFTTQNILIGGGLLFTVVLLGVVMVFAGRRTLPAWRHAQKRRLKDPVTQPIGTLQDTVQVRRRDVLPDPTQPHPARATVSMAKMVSLSNEGNPIPSNTVSIINQETTFGRDPRQVSVHLNDPSVDPLHARLVHSEDGSFTLFDAGTIAGTWINFAPISRTGARLQHGDVINIGRVSFRFEIPNSSQTRIPKVISPEENKL